MKKIGINGFGRIGRMVFRAALKDDNVEVLAVNDLTDTKTLAYLLKHDSVHGTLDADVSYDDSNIIVDGKAIKVLAERDPENLPWGELGVEIVIESTGFFRTRDACQKHINAGAKKVILSAPAKGELDKTIVLGVNDNEYNADEHHIVSNASCTTNCLAPIVKILNDKFGVEKGFMTTIHSYTGEHKLVDGPHSDLSRARSAAINLVPTSTGAAIAVAKVIPSLAGHMDGISVRAPTPDGSVTDFVCELKTEASVEEVNAVIKEASEGAMKGIVEYLDFPAVSSDIVGNPHSSIFDPEYTKVDGKMLKVLSWYDNEWGYSNRVVDSINKL